MEINKLIDHTELRDISDYKEISKILFEYQPNSIVVRPTKVSKFSKDYKTIAVIGFPEHEILCASKKELKALKSTIGNIDLNKKKNELKRAIRDGATGFDPVVNISNIDFKDPQKQQKLIEELKWYFKFACSVMKDGSTFEIKPIFSCECLTKEEIELSVLILVRAVYSFLTEVDEVPDIKFAYKTSTGFIKTPHGETLANSSPQFINYLASILNAYDLANKITIKASGGINTKKQITELLAKGRGRLSYIGTSRTLDILKGVTNAYI